MGALYMAGAYEAHAVPTLIPFLGFMSLFMGKALFVIASLFFFLLARVRRNFILYGMAIGISIIALAYNTYEESSLKDVSTLVNRENIYEITLDEYMQQREDFFVIDVREKEEFAQGHFTGAQNIPLGTILADKEIQNDIVQKMEDKKVIFFCYDGLRSQIAADIFAENKERVVVFRKGFRQVRKADDVEEIWDGSRKYVLPQDFHNALSTREYDLDAIPQDVAVADMTWAQEYVRVHDGAISAPLMRMSQDASERIVKNIGTKDFIGICNSRMSCFYAKILGYRVEKNGGYFRGYYRI